MTRDSDIAGALALWMEKAVCCATDIRCDVPIPDSMASGGATAEPKHAPQAKEKAAPTY